MQSRGGSGELESFEEEACCDKLMIHDFMIT